MARTRVTPTTAMEIIMQAAKGQRRFWSQTIRRAAAYVVVPPPVWQLAQQRGLLTQWDAPNGKALAKYLWANRAAIASYAHTLAKTDQGQGGADTPAGRATLAIIEAG